jgi:c-di-GMP-binding flagellar brake protein YcgR
MELEENIVTGNQIKRLLISLKDNQTLLKVQIAGFNEPILSVISQIAEAEDEVGYFQIDLPDTTSLAAGQHARFEFIGKETQYYNFESTVMMMPTGSVAVELPDMIRRVQRRLNFRVRAPNETKIGLTIDGKRVNLNVIDLSLGGTLALFARIETAKHPTSWLAVGNTLKDLEITFALEKPPIKIPIRKARIVRLEKGSSKQRYRYAFEFIRLDGRSKKRLTQVVYDLQRSFLRNRFKPDA